MLLRRYHEEEVMTVKEVKTEHVEVPKEQKKKQTKSTKGAE